jgi:hypothetical protein
MLVLPPHVLEHRRLPRASLHAPIICLRICNYGTVSAASSADRSRHDCHDSGEVGTVPEAKLVFLGVGDVSSGATVGLRVWFLSGAVSDTAGVWISDEEEA